MWCYSLASECFVNSHRNPCMHGSASLTAAAIGSSSLALARMALSCRRSGD